MYAPTDQARWLAESSPDWSVDLLNSACVSCGEPTEWRGPKGPMHPSCWPWTFEEATRKEGGIVIKHKKKIKVRRDGAAAGVAVAVVEPTNGKAEPEEAAESQFEAEPPEENAPSGELVEKCSNQNPACGNIRGKKENGKPEQWNTKDNLCWSCTMKRRKHNVGRSVRAQKSEKNSGGEVTMAHIIIALHDAAPNLPIATIQAQADGLVKTGLVKV